MSEVAVAGRTLQHPVREQIVAALWHSSEPLTARRLVGEYLATSPSAISAIVYHLRVLHRELIAEPADDLVEGHSSPTTAWVLGGDNSDEAIRQLRLGGGS